LNKTINQINSEISRLVDIYNADPSTKPNPADKKTWEKTCAELQAVINKQLSLSAAFTENNRILKAQLANLKTSKCPLSSEIICSQDKTAIINKIQEAIVENTFQIDTIASDLDVYNRELKETQEKIACYLKQEKAYMNKINILNRINDLKKTKPAMTKVSVIKKDFSEIKQILKDEKSSIIKYENAKKAKTEIEKQEKTIKMFSTLERITSKKGNVKAKILKLLLSTLVSSMNTMADQVCPHLHLNLEVGRNGNVAIYCKTPTGYQDYADISTGEKLMVQFLVMSQINQLSGFKILILDNLDKLDSKSFTAFLEFLSQPSVAALYDHIFVATVDHTDFIDALKSYPDVNVVTMS
jgi:hypothetical protein